MATVAKSPYRMSRHAQFYELADGAYASWNSLFPVVTILDSQTVAQLQALPNADSSLSTQTLKSLRRVKLVYRGDADPFEREFFRSAERALAAMDADAAHFYGDRVPYDQIHIVNSGCNLGCSYCVSYYGDEHRKSGAMVADRGSAREQAIVNVLDQLLTRKRECGHKLFSIGFNGGEILLRWPLIERLLDHVTTTYPEFTVDVHMNTNATLMTKEIAAKLAAYKTDVHVSIDGYESAHNRTRHYHTGGGSFDRVMAGVNNYREASHEPNTLKGFQGTIEDIDDFDDAALFAMTEHGFGSARLAPNLLKKNGAHGRKAALWEAQLAVKSQTQDLDVGQTHLHRILRVMDGTKGFRPHCGGLSGLRTRTLVLNIDSMQASQLCSFSSPGAVALVDAAYDIYNPALWQATRSYIASRIEMLRTACSGCDVLGSCQGSCVYNGMDVNNVLNPAGCAYQRSMFRHAIDYRHSGFVRPLADQVDDSVEPVAQPEDCGSGCSDVPLHGPADEAGKRTWRLTQVP